MGSLSKVERELARNRFAAEAAFGDLVASGEATPRLAERYAESGLQQYAEHDPAMAALDTNCTYNLEQARRLVATARHEDMQKWRPQFFEGALRAARGESTEVTLAYDATALRALQELDTTRAGFSVTVGNRESFQLDVQRDLMRDLAEAGAFPDPKTNDAITDSYMQRDARI